MALTFIFFRCVLETLKFVLRTIKLDLSTLGLFGSSLNIFLGDGPETIELGDLKVSEIEACLGAILEAYVETNNKDYLATGLMVALKVAENEVDRKYLRKSFLSVENRQ